MSRFLPDVAPLAAGAGLAGPMGARQLMAMEETSRRNAGTSGEANTNVRDFLSHLFGDPKRGLAHQFTGYGVDLNKVLLDAEKNGQSAPEAVIEQVGKLTKGKTATQTNLILGKLFHNQQSAQFARGWLKDMEYYLKLKKELENADSGTILHDFAKAFDAPQVKLNILEEQLHQIVRRFGEGFAALVPPISAGLGVVLALFAAIDARSPGTINKVLGIGGGFLALVAILGVLLPAFRAIGSGFMLLISVVRIITTVIAFLSRVLAAMVIAGGPILWILAAIAAAAFLIWQNWDVIGPVFWRVWEAVRGAFVWFWTWLTGWIGGAMTNSIDAIKGAWNGLKSFFAGLWGDIVGGFSTLIEGIETRIAKIRETLGLGGGPAAPPRPNVDTTIDPSTGTPDPPVINPYHMPGGAGPASYSPGKLGFEPLMVQVTVNGNATVDAPKRLLPVDRGEMLGRA